MKTKILIIAIILSATSCISRFQENSIILDYTKYKNFFISDANAINFNYIPMASVKYESLYIHDYQLSKKQKENIDPIYYINIRNTQNPDFFLKRLLDIAVQKAIKSGANGIINFQYTPIYYKNYIEGWRLSGMTIKIKDYDKK